MLASGGHAEFPWENEVQHMDLIMFERLPWTRGSAKETWLSHIKSLKLLL
jgi:hypothetical protein